MAKNKRAMRRCSKCAYAKFIEFRHKQHTDVLVDEMKLYNELLDIDSDVVVGVGNIIIEMLESNDKRLEKWIRKLSNVCNKRLRDVNENSRRHNSRIFRQKEDEREKRKELGIKEEG